MTTVSLDYASMKQVAGVLDAKEQAMSVLLARIKTIVDGLVAADFKTVKASPAFDALVIDIVLDMGKSIAAITNFADFLRGAADAYKQADQSMAEKLGGGGATSTLKVDMGEILSLKSNLKATHSAFDGVGKAADSLDAGVLGHHHLADAVQDFADGWDHRRKQITENVDDIYDAISTIAKTFTDVDTDLNKSLQG
ncbi:hypothetical protein SAMN04487968_112121 [Nocardioides terrae]|uniref:Uncharacterized protein n=1 Tax=Nocardioides terrae TaxID=574651 RepID=A0A1I1MRM2_9ACTN|nr:hypothetical protein [Nocardioides terrae]SFC85243.1 hypothetical protein SAMN04487968_112121 [Nocardioides terrae]